MMNQGTATDHPDSHWHWLYRVAGLGALISALIIPIQVLVFLIWPPPLEGTVSDWFMLLQTNWLVGLVNLDLLLVADNLLLIPIFLALYVALRRTSETVMAIATVLGLVGVILYVVTNPALGMLLLSNRYAAAPTDAQELIFLAAGQALLATWQGTAFHAAYLVGSIAGIAVGAVMLRTNTFSKMTAYMAILANAVGLGLYVPTVGVYISVFSVVFLEIWYILLARQLWQLGTRVQNEAANPEVMEQSSLGMAH